MKLEKFAKYIQKQELGRNIETAKSLIKQVRGGQIGEQEDDAFSLIVKAEQLYKKALAEVKDKIREMQKLKSKVDKEVEDEGVNRNNYEIGVDLFEATNKLKQLQKEIQKKINKVKNI